MKRTAALLACLLLTACGQKGALYLPDEARPVVPATATANPASPTASPATAPAGDAATTDEEQRRRQQQAAPGNNAAGN